jgi:CheY-like chemotaxis protein
MGRKPTVLCVDDQAPNLQIRTLMLQQFGCATFSASDHKSALRVVTESDVDVAVIDYHLANGENGEEVAHDIRALHPQLPLIMLTGENHLPASAVSSVDAVLIKGASNPRALLDLIERLIPGAELHARRPMLVVDPNSRANHD